MGENAVDEFVLQYGNHGLWYGSFTHFSRLGIRHGVSSRLGGGSQAAYRELNLGLHVGDDEAVVLENRKLFCQALQVSAGELVTAEQVHKDQIAVVTGADRGKGALCYETALAGTDALITNVAGVPLLLCYADCVPVLIVDPRNRAIGIAHAGWKGTVSKIGQKTVLAMQKQYNTRPEECLIGIGPSIGPCCYAVDERVTEQVRAQFSRGETLLCSHNGKQYLDLWQANCMQLTEIGVTSSNIVSSRVCTSCNKNLFFSYRADNGTTGRMGAVIQL
jgi:YfiH family protein